MYRIIDTGQDRDAWLEVRKTGITATDIARLATGGAAVRSAIRAEKNGHERRFSTRATEWGVEREPVIAQYAYNEWGMAHNRALLAAGENPTWLATPDLLGIDEVGDIKTTVHDWDGWGDVPRRYIAQLGWQMIVTGHPTARLVFEPHHGFVPLRPWPTDFVLDWDTAQDLGITRDGLVAIATEFQEWDGEPDEDAAEMDALLSAALDAKEIADDAAATYAAASAKIEEYLEGKPRQFDGSRGTLTRSQDTFTTTFDKAALVAAEPMLDLTPYNKITKRKGALRLTPRKDA